MKMILGYCLLICACLRVCQGAYVESVHSCSSRDEKCLIQHFEEVLKVTSEKGIPAYNIPPFDPMSFKELNYLILNTINITLMDVTIKGFKDSTIERLDVQIEKSGTIIELLNYLEIKGKYMVDGSHSLVEEIFGNGPIHGVGDFTLKIDKLKFIMILHYHMTRKENGEINFQLHKDEFSHGYSIEKALLDFDNVFIGENDRSKQVAELMNQNLVYLLMNFGRGFLDKIIYTFHDVLSNFLNNIPANYYLSDDLTKFLTV